MRILPVILLTPIFWAFDSTVSAESRVVPSGDQRQNNLVTILLETGEIAQPIHSFSFKRPRAGYIFLAADCRGKGAVTFRLDSVPEPIAVVKRETDGARRTEAVRNVAQGDHTLKMECEGEIRVEELVIKAIPELMHCGLGFDPAIQSYGKYDLDFLKKDILPNVTTMIVPSQHRAGSRRRSTIGTARGKRLLPTVGISSQAKTAEEHYRLLDRLF